jgi:hypothetical protein
MMMICFIIADDAEVIYPHLSPVTRPRLSTQLINQLVASQYINVIVDLLKVSVLYLTFIFNFVSCRPSK